MSKRILAVDDDPTLIKVIQPFLESHGFVVGVANDGEQAIEAVKKNRPDLIVLDIQMPRMNGYTFIFELKKIMDIKGLPIIVLTAKEGMAEIFKVEGVKEYICKPFKPEVLLTAIKKYVGEG